MSLAMDGKACQTSWRRMLQGRGQTCSCCDLPWALLGEAHPLQLITASWPARAFLHHEPSLRRSKRTIFHDMLSKNSIVCVRWKPAPREDLELIAGKHSKHFVC